MGTPSFDPTHPVQPREQQESAPPPSPSLPVKPLFITTLNKLEECRTTILSGQSIDAQALHDLFAQFGADLHKDPEIGPIIHEITHDHGWLVTNWKNGKNWMELRSAADVDVSRRKIVGLVIEIVDTLAKRDGLPKSKFVYLGTPGPKSDMDVTIFPKEENPQAMYSTHAILGLKAAMASVVWQALFGGTSHDQADTDFYPPQIGSYFEEEIADKEALTISSRATLATLFLQSHQCMKQKEWKAYTEQMNRSETVGQALTDIITDVESLQTSIHEIASKLPKEYASLLPAIFTSFLSRKLEAFGKKLECLSKGSPERDRLAARFYLLASLRERFLPEGYMSKGAYCTVCRNEGGQLSQRVDEMRDALSMTNLMPFIIAVNQMRIQSVDAEAIEQEFLEAVAKSLAVHKLPQTVQEEVQKRASNWFAQWKAASGGKLDTGQLVTGFAETMIHMRYGAPRFPTNTPVDLLESSLENLAYFFHRTDPVDASKYAKRFYEAAIELLSSFVRNVPSEMIAEIEGLNARLAQGLQAMNLLEATKRGKLAPEVFFDQVQEVFQKQTEHVSQALAAIQSKKSNAFKEKVGKNIVQRFAQETSTALAQSYSAQEAVDDLSLTLQSMYEQDEKIQTLLRKKTLSQQEKEVLWQQLVVVTHLKLMPGKQKDEKIKMERISNKHFGSAQSGKKRDFQPIGELRGQALLSELINHVNFLGYVSKEGRVCAVDPHLQGLADALDQKKSSARETMQNVQQKRSDQVVRKTSMSTLKGTMTKEAAELLQHALQAEVLALPKSDKALQFSTLFRSSLGH